MFVKWKGMFVNERVLSDLKTIVEYTKNYNKTKRVALVSVECIT